MIENTKLSETILKVIADTESYPARITPEDIRNSNAIKENFKDIDNATIVFHIKMLEEDGLIEAKFHDRPTLSGTASLVTIIGLTKKGSDYVKYIESPFWKQAIKDLKSSDKPQNLQLIFSLCDKLISRS